MYSVMIKLVKVGLYLQEMIMKTYAERKDGLCGLVVRVPGYRCRGSGFDFRRYKIF
jgi:hypothetical protein